MQDTFNVSHDSLAVLAPAAMLGGLIAAFLSGSIIGRVSIGPALVGGMAFAGVGMLGYAIAPCMDYLCSAWLSSAASAKA